MPKLVFQHNPNLEKLINRYGCNFTSLSTMVQLKSRYLFEPSELNHLYYEAQKKGYCNSNCFMKDPINFVRMCFDYVGAEDVKVGWDGQRVRIRAWNPSQYDFTLIDWKTKYGQHFCLGNTTGDMIFDPDNPRSKRYIIGFNNWRLWVARCKPLTDRQLRKLKNSRGFDVNAIDYVPGVEYGRADGTTLRTSGKIIETEIDPVPETPTEMLITDKGIEVSGGLIEYLNSMGGTLNLEM